MRYIIKYKEIKYNIISQKLGNIDGLIEDFFQAPDLLPLMVQVLRLVAACCCCCGLYCGCCGLYCGCCGL